MAAEAARVAVTPTDLNASFLAYDLNLPQSRQRGK